MLKGLRKRETYDELINELEEDPIKKYPDRRASQIENSNFMSQLALGFQEVVEQNNRIVKEKTKALLLQEMAASSNISHKQLSIAKTPPQDNMVYSVVRQGESGFKSTLSQPLIIPAKPDIPMEASTSSFKIGDFESRLWDFVPSRSKRKTERFNIADDFDDDFEKQQQEVIDEIEMQQMRDDSKLSQLLDQVKETHNDTGNTSIDDLVMRQNEQKGTKRETNSDSDPEEGKPKSKAKATPKKATRPNPEADNEPERTTKKQKNKKELVIKDKVIKEKVKHDTEKVKHDTEKVIYDTFDEWKKTNKGFLFDQIYKRTHIKKTLYNKKTKKEDLINLLLMADGKI